MVPSLCMCDTIPRIALRTRLVVMMHYKELNKTTNTSRLATFMLPNSELQVRGRRAEASAAARDPAPEGYQPLLLYPGHEARELTPELVRGLRMPVCLIVPDGTWRQARKVRNREPGVASALWVKLPIGPASEYVLRQVPGEGSLCTFEAIARALEIIEGSPGLRRRMEDVFRIRMERILWSKGRLRPEASLTGIPSAAIDESRLAGVRGGRKSRRVSRSREGGVA